MVPPRVLVEDGMGGRAPFLRDLRIRHGQGWEAILCQDRSRRGGDQRPVFTRDCLPTKARPLRAMFPGIWSRLRPGNKASA